MLGGAGCAAILFACAIGSVPLSAGELFGALGELLRGKPESLAATLLELRLGRALSAFVTGATLALAGVMMQALLRNPLADPYVLGVSGGAAVGALAAILFMAAAWVVDVAAFGGAIAVAFLLLLLARRDLRGSGGDGNAPMLLLTGVIVASGCGALITLMLSIAPDNRLRGMVFWLIGDLSATQLRWLPWCIWGAVLVFAIRVARAINVMALHAEAAATLGISVARLRQGLFLCSALLTASAVSSAGSIGFVGLIVPHACRFAWGPDHRLLLPAATLAGGSFLVLADTLARTVIAPQQLPVGVITALIGVPVFLVQLHQLQRR
ncbi:FecCD family ABC transporter permease [Noviherbaspirillum aerium]|uniref:FecCD family ABC transporter permease n=1 Tax=Noviherbaspirillum aerium TaxID=2588497 RepID=UPI00124D9CBD|nr:iron ABC transporter permease [Noviherbaspirillum aerium]